MPITRVGSFTLMLVINPNLPFHSIKELVAYAKANPGKLSFASGNTAGIVGGNTVANGPASTCCTSRTRAGTGASKTSSPAAFP